MIIFFLVKGYHTKPFASFLNIQFILFIWLICQLMEFQIPNLMNNQLLRLYGPLFWLNSAFTYILVSLGILHLIQNYFNSKNINLRKQSLLQI